MDSKPQRDDLTLLTGGPELLDRVSPLWSQLRRHHAELAPQWSATFLAGSFDQRRAALLAKGTRGLLVSLVTRPAEDTAEDIAYCVTTISHDGTGEVDSLYVAPSHRRVGVGHALISAAIDWLAGHSVHSVGVGVISGNQGAQSFYERYGFVPWTVRLRRSLPPVRQED